MENRKNNLLNRSKKSTVASLKVDDQIITDSQGIANSFLDFFYSSPINTRRTFPIMIITYLPQFLFNMQYILHPLIQ